MDKTSFSTKKYSVTFKKMLASYRDRLGADPYLDWWLICLVNAVCLVALVSWGAYMFQQINRGDFYAQPTTPTTIQTTLNRATLTKVTEMFKEKAVKFEQVQRDGVFTPDPSL